MPGKDQLFTWFHIDKLKSVYDLVLGFYYYFESISKTTCHCVDAHDRVIIYPAI
jgi:hypothetical protein